MILLIAPGGMLGQAFVAELDRRGTPYVAAPRSTLDLTRMTAVPFTPEIRTVINCAAFTAVDDAETNVSLATEINGHAVGQMIDLCDAIGAQLVHFSTDYVFDGDAAEPYKTSASRNPLNAYGRSKLLGENYVLASPQPHLLLRTSWVYASWGKNFVRSILRAAKNQSELRVVTDQVARPSSATQIASRTLDLVERRQIGRWHVADGGTPCSWFEFASKAVAIARLDCEVIPVVTRVAYPSAAPRPAYSALDLSETERLLGPTQPWQESLAEVVHELISK